MSIAYQYGLVTVSDDGFVTTPAGASALTHTSVEYEGTTPIVHSKGSWSPGMVVIACIVAIFTCGLGLILLFLSRSEKTATTVMDTVRITDGSYTYLAQAPGGASFVSWANTWRQSLLAHHELSAYSYEYSTDPVALAGVDQGQLALPSETSAIGTAKASDWNLPQPSLLPVAAQPAGSEPLAQAATTRFCPNCGSTIGDGMRFCSDCGQAAAS